MIKMIKQSLCTIATLFALASAGTAQAAIILSTSPTDANAGNTLELQVNSSGSLYVWASTNANQVMNALSLNINSSDANVLQATDHLVLNTGNTRWNSTGKGTLDDLVTNGFGLFVFGGSGIATNGLDDFQLFSEVQFDATALGSTNVSLEIGNSGASVVSGAFDSTFRGATVNVVTAIPEPGSLALLGLFTPGLLAVRRRRS